MVNIAGFLSKNTWGLSHFGIILPNSESLGINKLNFESKCKWSPFNGFKFKGAPTHTIIAGKIKMQDGKILGDPDGTPLQFS